MRMLLDTNIALRYAVRGDAQHDRVRRFVVDMVRTGMKPLISTQTLFESWVVATRPREVNGLAYSVSQARSLIDKIRFAGTVLPEPHDIVELWLDLCQRYDIKGKAAHDVRLVATMVGHGIRRFVTLNAADFSRFNEIEWVPPAVAEPG